jgi:hypothetical protein
MAPRLIAHGGSLLVVTKLAGRALCPTRTDLAMPLSSYSGLIGIVKVEQRAHEQSRGPGDQHTQKAAKDTD